jgi:hypothetical protein
MSITPVNISCIGNLVELIELQAPKIHQQALDSLYGYKECCPGNELLFKAVMLRKLIGKYNFNPGQFYNVPVTINKKQAECYCVWVTRRTPTEEPSQIVP